MVHPLQVAAATNIQRPTQQQQQGIDCGNGNDDKVDEDIIDGNNEEDDDDNDAFDWAIRKRQLDRKRKKVLLQCTNKKLKRSGGVIQICIQPMASSTTSTSTAGSTQTRRTNNNNHNNTNRGDAITFPNLVPSLPSRATAAAAADVAATTVSNRTSNSPPQLGGGGGDGRSRSNNSTNSSLVSFSRVGGQRISYGSTAVGGGGVGQQQQQQQEPQQQQLQWSSTLLLGRDDDETNNNDNNDITTTTAQWSSSHKDDHSGEAVLLPSSFWYSHPMMDVPEWDTMNVVDDYDDYDENACFDSSMNHHFPFHSEDVHRRAPDPLTFFEETHEEQDPAYMTWQEQQRQQGLQVALAELDRYDEQGRHEINALLQEQRHAKQESTERNLEKYLQRLQQEEKRDLARAMTSYQQKVATHKQRVAQHMALLQRKHAREMDHAASQQRQRRASSSSGSNNNAHNASVEAMLAAEWKSIQQQIQVKQQRQMQELNVKGDELKKKTDAEYKSDQDKIRKEYEKRRHDMAANKLKLNTKLYNGFQQVRQRYMKRHLQRISHKRDTILKQFQSRNRRGKSLPLLVEDPSLSPIVAKSLSLSSRGAGGGGSGSGFDTASVTTRRGSTQSTSNNKEGDDDRPPELHPPLPIKSIPVWATAAALSSSSGAAARHKHRKNVFGPTARQLSVEIHNEGIWISMIVPPPSSLPSTPTTTEITTNATAAAALATDHAAATGGGTSTSTRGANAIAQISSDLDRSLPGTITTVSDDTEFIPWGSRANVFLHAIVCGEIPPGLMERFDFGSSSIGSETLSVHGGQIRCALTDLRTSEATASEHRAQVLQDQEDSVMADLERNVSEVAKIAEDAEKAVNHAEVEEKECHTAVENATKEVEKAKRVQDEFKTKFKDYLDPDGNPKQAADPKGRQELTKALMGYENILELARRKEKTAKDALMETKARIKKLHADAKGAARNAALASGVLKKKKAVQACLKGGKNFRGVRQSEAAEMERASLRVKEVLACFQKVADLRREQNGLKKSTSFSSAWVQSFPGLPGPIKKSLWHRMHRRKLQIILRPTPECMINELHAAVAESVVAQNSKNPVQKSVDLEGEWIRAEQLFLLMMHPVVDEKLPTTPPSKSGESWAEPGWHLNLDVPWQPQSSYILPRAPSFPVLERNLSEITSAPGRQAASLIHASHIKCLSSPLSSFAVASSPAESRTTLPVGPESSDGDPLDISTEAMAVGYTFNLKQASLKASTSTRKKPATTKEKPPPVEEAKPPPPEEVVKKTPTKPHAASGNKASASDKAKTSPSTAPTEKKKSETKKRRNSRGTTSKAASASASASVASPSKASSAAALKSSAMASKLQKQKSQTQQSQSSQNQAPRASQLPAQQQSAPAAQTQLPPTQQSMPVVQKQRQQQQPPHPPYQTQVQQQHTLKKSPQQQPLPPRPAQGQLTTQQMVQLRMMQQQQQQQQVAPRHSQSGLNLQQQPQHSFPPTMHALQQFYSPLNHPTAPSTGANRLNPMQQHLTGGRPTPGIAVGSATGTVAAAGSAPPHSISSSSAGARGNHPPKSAQEKKD